MNNLNLEKLKDGIYFCPLGGSGEIGMNLNLYIKKASQNIEILIIDCGIGFADENIPGVDILTPKVEFLEQNRKYIKGLIITHIHEDHIGAVGYLWHVIKSPVFCSPLAKDLFLHKLKDYGVSTDGIKFNEISYSTKEFKVGKLFDLEAIFLTHSTPEMAGIAIKTDMGPIFHTGDWKFDDKPIVGEKSQYDRLKQLGKQGVYAIVCDSTNVFSEGWSGSEGDLEKNLVKIVKSQKSKVVITTFASNVARLHTIANVAHATKRKLVVSGFSLHRIIGMAQKNGYLNEPHHVFLDIDDASGIADDKLLVLCTGCQGEEMASVAKMAYGRHKIRLNEGDTIVFSSKIIPGNDKKLFSIFNKLTEKNIKIITERDHKIHVSGHPNQDELKKMYSLVKPKFAIPVHGEQYHIFKHSEMALQEFGVDGAIRVKNGDFLELLPNTIEKIATVPHGRLCIDGSLLRNLDSSVIAERKKLTNSGIVTTAIVVNSAKKLTFVPKLSIVGLLEPKTDFALIADIESAFLRSLEDFLQSPAFDKSTIISKLQNNLAKLFLRATGKSPIVEILFHVL